MLNGEHCKGSREETSSFTNHNVPHMAQKNIRKYVVFELQVWAPVKYTSLGGGIYTKCHHSAQTGVFQYFD